MHICFITNEYPKEGFPHGGVGTFIKILAKELVGNGHAVSVVGINNYTKVDEVNSVESVNVYRLKPKRIKGLTWLFNSFSIDKKIKAIHAKSPIDIVETAELGLAFISKLKNVKYVIRMHGGHHFFAKYENRKTKFRHALMEKKSFKKADELIAVSEFVGKETLKLLQIENRNFSVIFNPIDTSRFYQSSSSKVEPYSIFFAGTIVEKKGIRQLVQSLEYLIEGFPKVMLYIAGRDANIPGTSKPYRPILDKAITSQLKKHIKFLGVVPNDSIPSYIEKAQVCCYPSHMEAMPLAWLEVMAMGKIFIGSSIGPGKEAVIDNETGFLVDPMKPKEIADKIKYVFNNYDECIKIARKGRERICEEFDINILVKENIDTYQKIISN